MGIVITVMALDKLRRNNRYLLFIWDNFYNWAAGLE